MNRILPAAALLLLLVAALPVGHAQEAGTYYGDGSDGAITRSASGTEPSTVILQATTYTVNAGVVMTCSQNAGAALVILATVSITVHGTLDCNGRGSAGGVVGTTGASGVGSAGSGSTGAASVSGGAGNSPRFLFQILQCGANGQSTMGAGGGGGGQGDAVNVRSGGGGGGAIKAGAASGAAGTTTAIGGTAGVGGNGGGGIFLVAPSITIGATAALKADGANGAAGTSNSGGGGGGAGGVICLWSRDLSIHAAATLTARGGNGGNGGGTGATGGQGGTITSPTPTAGSAPSSTGGGGGGGGAGGLLIKKTGTPSAYASLLALAAEPAGANCVTGGTRIRHGLDNGDGAGTARDGILQDGEVDATAYACHGTTGAAGPIGIAWQGEWDEDANYAQRDAVHFAGSAWYALQANFDSPPYPGSPDWDFIANADGVLVDADVEEEQAAWQETLGEYAYFLCMLYFVLTRLIRAPWVPYAGLLRIMLDVLALSLLQTSGLPDQQFARIATMLYGFLVIDLVLVWRERKT